MPRLITATIARIQPLDTFAVSAARARQEQLTKPRGALGRLETLSLQLAGITRNARPRFQNPIIITLAADHGITRQGVSAYPSAVTSQMVLNFVRGGAAINVLARHVGARVVVADVGVDADFPADLEIIHAKLGRGTNDFLHEPAMTRAQAERAVETGIEIVTREIARGADIVGTGEMGIGNTTASSAMVAAMTRRAPREVTGRGTGIDDAALENKIAVIERALDLHKPKSSDALAVLASVGGFEIGGLAGVMLGAAAQAVPVVVDGFISGAAALLACTLAPQAQPYLIPAHRSVEIGHRAVLEHLQLEPLFDLDLRLGEGTGAALGISLCSAAAKILDEMATFADAGISEKV
jgi:nicotinate-nucleotide--dimethylbenzimidazole phosphoribosyltransferase